MTKKMPDFGLEGASYEYVVGSSQRLCLFVSLLFPSLVLCHTRGDTDNKQHNIITFSVQGAWCMLQPAAPHTTHACRPPAQHDNVCGSCYGLFALYCCGSLLNSVFLFIGPCNL